jgi:quercetin dioxygenase-like cupin family protein
MPIFVQADKVEWKESCPSVNTLYVAGKSISISFNRVKPGMNSPPESHPEEQVNIVLQGMLELVLGENQDDVYICGPNSILFIEPNLPHATRVIGNEEVLILSAFYPRRHLESAITSSFILDEEGRKPK